MALYAILYSLENLIKKKMKREDMEKRLDQSHRYMHGGEHLVERTFYPKDALTPVLIDSANIGLIFGSRNLIPLTTYNLRF